MSTDSTPENEPKSGRPARTSAPAFATIPSPYFPALVGIFVGVMIISNITGTKAVSLWSSSLHFEIMGLTFDGLPTDGAFYLFPLAYVLGDVISEVYGFKAMRRVIAVGFGMLVLTATCMWITSLLPAPADAPASAAAFDTIATVVPMLLVAGLAGYVVGEFMNSYVLVRMKAWTGEKHLWSRLLGSTVVGEFFDTLVFCSIAAPAIGWSGSEFVAYTIIGFVWKTLVEIVIMPLSYAACAFLKRREPSYQQALLQV
ncbi:MULTISPECIES: queuosine precursor transporter [Tsukamurella]|uniref:Probable queuosine precursor transporter n=1 Tax=Tsukamurella strandjordii TaxID=147577 RepID=A0AA90NK12_9ACTN|nr:MULTISPECIES: queuosine precursor transporter [Tsukamurella]MDP0400438.1 queuosine precursor transporter [Tsukamurella strandjordii]GIZ98332.1 hypothetical protein TTY48_29440 [Tsukamurella sp. TY48]